MAIDLDHASRAENRIRTDDLLITNELLYQLSYLGIKNKYTQYRLERKDCGEKSENPAIIVSL